MKLKYKLEDLIAEAIISGNHGDPFAVLGMHKAADDTIIVRVYQPTAENVELLEYDSEKKIGDFVKVHEAGLFQIELDKKKYKTRFAYKLNLHYWEGHKQVVEDPYRFSPILGEMDIYLLAEGNHLEIYKKLGAHPMKHENVTGVSFAVWAPNAKRVSVIGNFNNWDGRVHPMRLRVGCGVWEIFIPNVTKGDMYKFEIKGANGNLMPLKTDPVGFYCEKRPSTASIVYDLDNYTWGDEKWQEKKADINALDKPVSIYEVHLGSWRRNSLEGLRYLTYRELADELVPYVKDLGFTHVELLPVTEHPFDGSWGYQATGMFAPTSRFGSPDDFRYLVDRFHQENIGVILDWVPGHFPKDGHGLANFDGTALYEHADPRKGEHMDWGTKIYNFGRSEVQNFLASSAMFWLKEYHIDGLRVDAVASMLYLDYSRKDGEWVPNEDGGNENKEAIAFLRRMNELVFAHGEGATTYAEESTAWPMVSRPTYMGGLGFGFKWNMGWMHDSLEYMEKDAIHRRYHHNLLTFGPIYAFNENFVLPLSHDEVVHGKGSLIGKMSGDRWQRFANLRAYYGFMFTHPGKQLLFMGGEFGQEREWNADDSLSWHLLNDPMHQGVQNCVKDLNKILKEYPALHEKDFDGEGFEWIDYQNADESIISYVRRAKDYDDFVVVCCNFTPVPRSSFKIGVPTGGFYKEVFNSDSELYGGSGMGSLGGVEAKNESWNYRDNLIEITLPPMSTVVFAPKKK
jgi:1,4-alpha-glucan branching enzyme